MGLSHRSGAFPCAHVRAAAPSLATTLASIASIIVALAAITSDARAQRSWAPANEGIEGADISDFFETRAGTLLAGTISGIYRLDDTERWQRVLDVGVLPGGLIDDGAGGILLGAYGLLYRSLDDGRSWDLFDSVVATASAPDGGLVMLRAASRSTDRGVTWEPVAPVGVVYELLNLGSGRLVVRAYDSLRTSSDTGRTWKTQWFAGAFYGGIVTVGGATVVRAGYRGVEQSTDAGETWTHMSSLPVNSLDGNDGVLVAASLALGRDSSGLYRSIDTGRTWTQHSFGAVWSVGLRSNGEILAATHPDVHRSTDGGASWHGLSAGLAERVSGVWRSGESFLAASYGHALYAPNNSRAYELHRSDDDGATWTSILDSVGGHILPVPGSAVIGAMRVVETHDDRYLSSTVHVSTDRGETWLGFGEGSLAGIDANASGRICIAMRGDTASRSVHHSTDDGETWSSSKLGYPRGGVAVTPSGRMFVGVTDDASSSTGVSSVQRSDDGGLTWRPVFDGIALGLIAVSDDVILAVASRVGDGRFRVYRTGDGGERWDSIPLGGDYQSFGVDSARDVVLLVRTRDSEYHLRGTTDGGLSWTDAVGSTRFQIGEDGQLFRFAYGELERSLDLGASWILIDSASAQREWITAAANGRVLIAGTWSNGLFRTPAPAFLPVDPDHHVSSASLAITPLPATERITIALAPGDRYVRILDVRGELAIVRNDTPGASTMSIDLTALPEGVYLVEARSLFSRRIGRAIVRR